MIIIMLHILYKYPLEFKLYRIMFAVILSCNMYDFTR